MPHSPRRSLLLALLLLAIVALAAGCAGTESPAAITPTIASPSPTAAAMTLAAAEAPAIPTAAAVTPTVATDQATLEPTETPEMPTSTPSPAAQDLGLSVGTQRLAVALGPIATDITLHFERTTMADGIPAWIGVSPAGNVLVEIIGPEDSPVTASVAVLLPEGDGQAQQMAREALYQTIGAAMPERAWAIAWLNERVDDALAGTPFSITHGDYYVQIVRLGSPEPCIHLAVTLTPRTLTLPNWDRLETPGLRTVDAWERLPIMPAPVRGQHLPTDELDMYEYTVEASAREVEAFYIEEMPAAGWELVDHAVVGDPAYPEQDQIILLFRRGKEGAIITLDGLAAMQKTLVTLGYAENAADLPAIAG